MVKPLLKLITMTKKGDGINGWWKYRRFCNLRTFKKNAKNDKVADFVIKVFMSELSNEPWYDKCESMLDDYIEDD